MAQVPPGADLARYLVPLGIAAVVIVARNSRPRQLKIERLWMMPAIYLVLMTGALAEAPPPITPVSIAILAAAFVLGAAIGWQRARFTQIHIHPETHELTSRASPIGLVFILGVLVVRYAALPEVYTWLNRLNSLLNQDKRANGTWIGVSQLSASSREELDAACGQALEELSPIAAITEPRIT